MASNTGRSSSTPTKSATHKAVISAYKSTPADQRNVKGVAKTAAKQAALNKATSAAATKGAPLAGADRVLENPTSAKAWAVAGARTAVAAGLAAIGLGAAGKWVEEVIHRIGYKRLLIGLALMLVAQSLMSVMIILMTVVVAEETVLKPVSIVASVIGKASSLFSGEDGDKTLADVPSHICKPVPKPKPAVAKTPSTESSEDSEAGEEKNSPPPSSSFTPEPVIGEDGKIKPDVVSLSKDIPRGSQALQAETWLLYVMAHPEGDTNSSWDAFAPLYTSSFQYVSDKKIRQTKSSTSVPSPTPTTSFPPDALNQRETITPLEVVMHIDPAPYYEPFELAASTMTASLMLENEKQKKGDPAKDPHILKYSDDQLASVLGRMEMFCGV